VGWRSTGLAIHRAGDPAEALPFLAQSLLFISSYSKELSHRLDSLLSGAYVEYSFRFNLIRCAFRADFQIKIE